MTPAARIIYLCNIVRDDQRDTFYFADSAVRKIRAYEKLLESGGIAVETLSLASPKKALFRPRYSRFIDATGDWGYYVLRLLFEWRRLARSLVYLTRERKNYAAVFAYSYTTMTVALCCFARYFLRKRVVLDYEDGLFRHATRGWYYRMLEKIALRICRSCVLVNAGLAQRLPAGKMRVVINGVFVSGGRPAAEPVFSGNGRMKVLYSGELSFDYGLGLLYKVFRSAGAGAIDFHVTGAGKDAARLREFIAEKGLKNVFFHGYIPLADLTRLEQEINGYILLQNEDSPIYDTNFPSKLFHFLSSGKPVFFNRCVLFAGFEGFENAFAITDPENAGSEISRALTAGKARYPGVAPRLEAYNAESFRKLKMVLVDEPIP